MEESFTELGSNNPRHQIMSHHSHHPPISNPNSIKRLRHTSDNIDESSSDVSSTLEREAPDGGYGWVVVAVAFFINLIADGVTFSYGVFLPIIQKEFGTSKSTTTWAGSLLASMPLLSGPIASTLTDRYGCRNCTIVGGILATLGFILSYYATSIHMLMLTFGVITGFGLSLCYVAAVVIVAYYFDKRRSLATGLSVCGGGIGTFIFGPLNSYLIEQSGWRVTLLVDAGCFFSLCFCAILMKDLEWTKKSNRKREKVLQNEHDFNTQAQLNLNGAGSGMYSIPEGGTALIGLQKSERLCNSAVCIPTFVREAEQLCLKNNGTPHFVKNGGGGKRIRYYSNNYGGGFATGGAPLPAPVPSREENTDLNNEDKSGSGGQEGVAEGEDEVIIKDDKIMTTIMMMEENESDSPLLVAVTNNNNNSSNNGEVKKSANNLCDLHHHNNLNSHNHLQQMNTKPLSNNHKGSNKKGEVTESPPSPSIIEKNGLVNSSFNGAGNMSTLEKQAMGNYLVQHTRNWGNHRNSLTYRGAVLNLKRSRMRPLRPATSCPDIISVATADDNTPEWKAALQDIYVWMQEIFALDHLKNTRFVLFIMSNFLLYMWYDIPLTFLADTATGLGYSEGEGAMLGSAIGLLTVFGNIILGYLGDKKWANSVTIYGLCISICGVVTGLMPCLFGKFFSMGLTYYFLVLLCGVFGLMIAANYSLTPVILLQVVSLEKFTPAYGLLLLVQGIGNLIGPPIAGLLYDYTGEYAWSFWIAGGGIFISNFFILAPIYQRHQARYEESTRDISGSRSSGRSSSSCEEGRGNSTSPSGSIVKDLDRRMGRDNKA